MASKIPTARTAGTRVVSKDVIHGYLHERSGPATLLIYEVVFNLGTNIGRIESVHVDCLYAGYGGSKGPEVLKVAPGAMSLVPATQAETIIAGGETKAGSAQIQDVPSGRFKWEKGVSQKTATIRGSVRSELENQVASWTLEVNPVNPSAETDMPTGFRAVVLLKRSGNDKFQCTWRINAKTSGLKVSGSWLKSSFAEPLLWRSSSRYDPIIYDPSLPSTIMLDIQETENLELIDLLKFCYYPLDPPSKSPGKDPIPAAKETKLEQTPITASELLTPEKTGDWESMSSYLHGPAAGVPESSDPVQAVKAMPPHIWVINQHAEDITIVVSKYRRGHRLSGATPDTSDTGGDVKFSNTSFLSPAIRKTLAPYARDPERSSALFPFWTREDGFGVISIFTGPDKILCLENDLVSAGSWIYFKHELDMNILEVDEATSSKSAPLFPITINGNTVNLETEAAPRSSAQSNYILVQSWMPLALSQMKELESMNLSLHSYVSKNTYLYRRQGTDLDKIRRLFYVAYVDIYKQGYKISASLGKVAQSPQYHSLVPHEVDIVFHNDVNPEKLRKDIAEMAHLRADKLNFGQHKLRQMIQEQYLANLASIDEVQAIEKVHKLESQSHIARVILRADAGDNPVAQPNHAYDGEGEVVTVADTGFDTGHIRNIHHAFLDRIANRVTTRVLSIYPLSKIPLVNDFDGHGTHVCALAIGSGTTTEGRRIRGTAPGAKLVVQCLGPYFDGVPENLVDLFEAPYHNNGARVHVNSWGTIWRGNQHRYGEAGRAEEIDKFVSEKKDPVICFAAGNNNDPNNNLTPAQIGAEAAAKNCITVGATHNNKDYPNEVANFSSRGPTVEGRIKPDVVAPGISVLSANSAYNVRPSYHDPNWTYLTGTSMATPLVAGCAAVLRQAVKDKWAMQEPSAALIKALLVNGAVSLPRYSRDASGFGRVDLANSLANACKTGDSGFDEENIHSGDEEPHEIPIMIPKHDGRGVLKVTLVWSDPPGNQLIHDLDLAVEASDNTEYHGNRGASNDPGDFDRCNNVEQVEWAGIPAGKATIFIKVYSGAGDAQAQAQG